MNTEAIRQRLHTFASENHPKDSKERLAMPSKKPLRSHLQSLCQLSANSCTGESSPIGVPPVQQASRTCRQWLDDLWDGIFAHYQQDVSRQSVPTDQLSVQYLYCTDSVRSVLTDNSRQRQRVVVPSPSFSQVLPILPNRERQAILWPSEIPLSGRG